MRHPLQPLYNVNLFTNQRKAKCSKGFVVFSPQGRQSIISRTPSLAFQPLSCNLKSRVLPLPPTPVGFSCEQNYLGHPSSLFRKMFTKGFLPAEPSKAAQIGPLPADNVYDFYFPKPQFKSRWEEMSQRETPLLLADDSSIIIWIFPNLQNVNILGGKKMQTFHISFLMRFLVAPPHPRPPPDSLTSGD